MNYLKQIALIVLIILLLNFIKTWADNSATVYSVFLRNLVACLQLFALLGISIVSLIQLLLYSRKRRPIKYVAPTILFLIFLTVLELLTAQLLRNPKAAPNFLLPALQEYYGYYNQNSIEFDKRCSQYDPMLSYTMIPNKEVVFSNFEFDNRYLTNELGLRDDNNSLKAPPIICLGDSYTLGWGVEQEETFCNKLQANTGMKVLNAGISSYGTARELINFTRLDRSNLRYLLIQFCFNDTTENEVFIKNNYVLPIMSSIKYDSLASSLRWRLTYFPFKHILTLPRTYLRTISEPKNKTVAPPEATRFERYAENFIKSLRQFSSRNDSFKIIVFGLSGLNVDREGIFMKLLREKTSADSIALPQIEFLNMTPFLTSEHFYRMDKHLNLKGHAKVGEILSNKVKEENRGR